METRKLTVSEKLDYMGDSKEKDKVKSLFSLRDRFKENGFTGVQEAITYLQKEGVEKPELIEILYNGVSKMANQMFWNATKDLNKVDIPLDFKGNLEEEIKKQIRQKVVKDKEARVDKGIDKIIADLEVLYKATSDPAIKAKLDALRSL